MTIFVETSHNTAPPPNHPRQLYRDVIKVDMPKAEKVVCYSFISLCISCRKVKMI